MMKKKKEIHTQELEKKRLIDLYQTGIVSLEEITPRLDRIRNRINSVEQEYKLLEEEKHRDQKQLQLIEQFSTFQDKFSSRLGELTFDEKQQVVRLLVEEVLVDSVNEQLVVKHVIPLDKSFPLRSRSKDTTLRRSRLRFDKHPVVKNPSLEPPLNQAPKGRECLDLLQESFMVNAIKTLGDISIQDVLGQLFNRDENRTDSIVYRASRSESIAVGFEPSLPLGLKHEFDQSLEGSVVESRDR
jgi:hypothetical protein